MFQLSLRVKLTVAFIVFGIVPMLTIYGVLHALSRSYVDAISAEFERMARMVADKVDHNMMERHRDVQTFGLNSAISERQTWYASGSQANAIAAVMNHYVETCEIYPLMVLVDLQGRVIAVNDKNAQGDMIDTAFIYKENFASAIWFKDIKNKNFAVNKSRSFAGTVFEDLYIDPFVRDIYGNEGLALGFAAPVYNADGDMIAIWKNIADFAIVENVVQSTYQELVARGLPMAELTILDKEGAVIVDYDPLRDNTTDIVRDMSVIKKLNLVASNADVAMDAVKGAHGHTRSFHARKGIYQFVGYHHFKGTRGFPDIPWSVLVRVDEKNTKAFVNKYMRLALIMGVFSLVVIIPLGVFLIRGVVRPLGEAIVNLTRSSDQIASASNQVSAASHLLARGANQQASNLEETSASLQEMSSITKQNADNARQANTMANDAKSAAEEGNRAMEKMLLAINNIKNSSDETAKIVKTIDEIAFQTNLLALNAAVEAARAGDAGKGFAVVAEEVRNLAQRSAEAAKTTAALIEEAQSNAEGGVRISSEVNEVLTRINEGIVKVVQLVGEVAAASDEQAKGIDQVNGAATELDRVTQSNAGNAQELASASEQLSAQARELNTLIHHLRSIIGGNAVSGTATTTSRPRQEDGRKKASFQDDNHVAVDFRSKSTVHTHAGDGKNHRRAPHEVIPLDDDFKDF